MPKRATNTKAKLKEFAVVVRIELLAKDNAEAHEAISSILNEEIEHFQSHLSSWEYHDNIGPGLIIRSRES